MPERLEPVDVVIVGMGAAGGIAALPLTEAGLQVVGLEAGPWRRRSEYGMDEIRNDVRNAMGAVKANQEVPTSRAKPSDEATPTANAALMMNGVGGSSIHYSGQSWRLQPFDFEVRSRTIARYGHGRFAKGAIVEDWPFTYDDLEPYYDRVEYLIGVSGKAGNLKGKRDPRGNVLEGPRAREYPMPPLRRSGYNEAAHRAGRALGGRPFPGPAAINSENYRGAETSCHYCGFCTTNGCHADAKGSVNLSAIPRAQATGNLEVRTGCRVVEVVAGPDGRVTGVDYIRDRRTYHQPAAVVLLAAYTYENVRLMLLSKSKAFPRGLANNNGWVGKGYTSHAYAISMGVFPQPINGYSPSGQYTAMDDWDGDHFDHSKLDFIGGAGLGASTEFKPISGVQGVAPGVPQWGSEWKAWVARHAMAVGTVLGQMDMFPYEDTFIDLDPVAKDPAGYPVARVTFEHKPQELARIDFILQKGQEWLKEMGAEQTWGFCPTYPVMQHAYGGTLVGHDRDTSVLDSYSMAHESPNLGVLGSSCFPTTGGRNPTETLQAMAWRTADHIVERWNDLAG
jgi:gluconate 2-dehydrogenase alpha chain